MHGHLASSLGLLKQGRDDGAVLHAGHGSDYFASVLPPVRDAASSLSSSYRSPRGSALDSEPSESVWVG